MEIMLETVNKEKIGTQKKMCLRMSQKEIGKKLKGNALTSKKCEEKKMQNIEKTTKQSNYHLTKRNM